MKITLAHAKKFVTHMKLDMRKEIFTYKDLINGMNVELEHGKRNKETNVTNNDIIMTGKIALAHLREFPDYYKRLSKLEKAADKYWKGKPKIHKVVKKVTRKK